MARIVVGVGNDLRGDDAAGWETVRRLAPSPSLVLHEHPGDAPGLVSLWGPDDEVVIVDAVERAEELKVSFCSADPDITQRFAAATFLADNRADLEKVTVPALVLQIANDAVAPRSVGQFCHERLSGSTLVTMPVSGHCPHLTHPVETIAAIRAYLGTTVP